MDMRLGIEPLHVIERRHIEKALEVCRGKAGHAAELLGIGRATIFRKMGEWRQAGQPCTVIREPVQATPTPPAPYQRRRKIEQAIEQCGGNLTEAAALLKLNLYRVQSSLAKWHDDNARMIRDKAEVEGISEDEIQVMLRHRSIEEHANLIGFSIRHTYTLIDEALALVGLRRYRHRLFLL